MPALTSLLLGPHGSIWARRSPPLVRVNPRGLGSSDYGLLGGDEWDVFDGEGVYLGSIHLPDQLRLPIVHGNRIIGVIRGDSDKDIVVSILLAGFSGVRDQTGGA